MEDPRIISALFIFLKMAYYNVLINTFTADSETMKVEVAFTFDATSLDGKQLVTFEELYDLSNPDEPKKVTEHKDIEDKGQTITFKEKPEEPEKPETPLTPEKPNRPSDSPKTPE